MKDIMVLSARNKDEIWGGRKQRDWSGKGGGGGALTFILRSA